MEWKANWIWNGNDIEKNQWICFRKSFCVEDILDEAIMHITADSRYQLFINGKEIHMGPARSWPVKQDYDVFSVKDELQLGENVIAILVNFYGESTSQYLHGKGGLLSQLECIKDGEIQCIVTTDETWKWTIHSGYVGSYCRINIAQPWVEVYDASAFDSNWTKVDYDDSNWENANVIGSVGCSPWDDLQERSVPTFSRKEVYAQSVIESSAVISDGLHACVNVRDNFFPGTTDTIDKGFLGYLAVILKSPCENKGKITLICRKTPATSERMKLNGVPVLFSADEDAKEVTLNAGENFLLIDISGYHQRFNMNYHFKFEYDIELKSPWYSESPFVTIGPFQTENLLNIVAIDNPLDYESPIYQSVWNTNNEVELELFKSFIQPIDKKHCWMENPHILTMTDKLVETKRMSRKMDHILLPNLYKYTLVPNGYDQRIVIDFGKELSGLFELDINASEGVIVDADFAECYWDGKFELSQDMNSAFRYITKAGRQKYCSHLRRGFRYVIMTFRNVSEPIDLHLFKAYELAYSIIPKGKFQCSDWKLNKIWEISSRSVELCMEDTYVDCPAFEQAYWIGDGRIEALVNYYTHGAYELTKRSISLVGESLKKSDLPEAQVPTGCNTVLTAWFLLWILSCKEYYEYTKDAEGLIHTFKDISLCVERLESYVNQDGLFEINGWNMLDWAGMDTPVSGVVTHQNFLLVKTLRESAAIADLLEEFEKAEYFRKLADRIQCAANRILWNEEKQAFIDSIHSDGVRSDVISIQTNIMSYLCGCVDGEREKLMVKYILNPPEDFIKIGSPFMSFFYYEALEKLEGYDSMIANIRNKWGDMLKYGATSCWETFLGFEKDRLTRSHCHGWSAAPGYFLPRVILGVKPIKPGFEEFVVEPYTSDLTWARGQVPTPYGCIYVEWELVDGKPILKVDAPKECVQI